MTRIRALLILDGIIQCESLKFNKECDGDCIDCPLFYEFGAGDEYIQAIKMARDSLKGEET